MQWDNPRLAFPDAGQYAFLFENAHLLLLSWDRDNAKFLFLIREHRPDGLVLDYPGVAFTNRVLDTIENIFFVQVEEDLSHPTRYVLGSYFVVSGVRYGAFYERDEANPQVVLFRIEGESPQLSLEVLEEDEFALVAAAFSEQHSDMIEIGENNQGQTK